MPYPVAGTALAEFQRLLIGTWRNDPELMPDGRPPSFNVMPLPQVQRQPRRPEPANGDYGGFILKNFSFNETIRFNGTASKEDPPILQDPRALAVVAGAPNRGGTYTQFAHAVFYEQQVRFAEGPQNGKIVHVENGAWLHLGSEEQNLGPYGEGKIDDGQVLRQPPYLTVAKQIAVPHGNSVLALGNIDLNDGDQFDSDAKGLTANTVLEGAPVIPDQFVPYPQEADEAARRSLDVATGPQYDDPYARELKDPLDFENPNPGWTLNPSFPLQRALELIEPKAHMHWRVTTLPLFGGEGSVTNIPFEEQKSKVTAYWADYWLVSQDPNARETLQFDYLLYSQTVLMEMEVSTDKGAPYKKYIFPHITSNVVKKLPGTPAEARDKSETPLE
ncbi:MAG TPA: heme-binding protein [Solirubrobacteraceae bacterium]|nr:heme-binding protein [Solirubrobacteraceae bacterium]